MTRIGDYEIETELGVGGMARVYRAKHAFLETMHAIKVLDPEFRANAEARRRFLDEAKIQAKHLQHANIVKVTNIVATEQHAALVMELVDGGSLESQIHELKSKPDEIKRIMIGVLDAVGHAHAAGIVHRDLKPANVLLAREGGSLVPKVTDFGIAKVTDIGDNGKREPLKARTSFDARMGTLPYMSPEQIRRAKDVTARSDLWSLGAMLYELATGELPFPGDSEFDVMEAIVNGKFVPPATKHPGIDRRIAAVIEKALSVDPAQRYASCAEMAAALRDAPAAAAKPPPPPPPPPLSEALPPRSKVPLIAAACLVGAAGLGGAAFYISRGSDAETPTTGSAAAGSGSAADPQKAVAALRAKAAQSGATDPWAATASDPAAWNLADRAFPTGFEGPPSSATKLPSGVYLLPMRAGTGRVPKLGDVASVNIKIWNIETKQLVESNIGEQPRSATLGAPPTPLDDVLTRLSPGGVARVWARSPDGSERILIDLELVEAQPPARPEICAGTFKSGEDLEITVNGAALGVCGSYTFTIEGYQGPMRCHGDLTCSDGKAEFKCSYDKLPAVSIAGTMTFTCSGDALAADITTGGKVRSWILPRVAAPSR